MAQGQGMRTTGRAAVTLLATLLACCGSGGGGSGGGPSPEPTVNGLWQVVARQVLTRNDPSLQPIPIGSILTIVDEQLVGISIAGTSITWLTDEASIEDQMGRSVGYSNDWDVPLMSGGSGPAGRGLDYGWDELGLADAFRETLEVLAFDGTTMSIAHRYEYQLNLATPLVFMHTGYFIEFMGPATLILTTDEGNITPGSLPLREDASPPTQAPR